MVAIGAKPPTPECGCRFEAEVERLTAERGEFSDVLYRATQAEAKIEAALAWVKSQGGVIKADPDQIIRGMVKALTGGRE